MTCRHPCKLRLSRSNLEDNEFEWDDAKADEDLDRHGVSFEAARRVFDDVFAVEREDHRQDYGEERYSLTGMVGGRLVYVAYTMRGERIRIIMARYAGPFKSRLYHDDDTWN